MYPQSTGTPDVSATSPTDRLVAMLADPNATFTRDQVAWLMGQAQRWGYEARETEENDEWVQTANRPPVRVLGIWFNQATERMTADAAAALTRTTDYPGGPVPVWGEETTTRKAA